MGELLILEKSFVATIVQDTQASRKTFNVPTIDFVANKAYLAEHEALIFQIFEKIRNSQVDAARVSMLYDGENNPTFVPSDMDFFRFNNHPDLLSDSLTLQMKELSSQRLRGILNVNCFGTAFGRTAESADPKNTKQKGSSLFIVTSLINHSSSPTVLHIGESHGVGDFRFGSNFE